MIENKRFVIVDSQNFYDTFEKRYYSSIDANDLCELLDKQEEKIKELQERNNRQYNQLTHMWECIRNKDYETLQKEWVELEEADKLLQEEFKCYIGDV